MEEKEKNTEQVQPAVLSAVAAASAASAPAAAEVRFSITCRFVDGQSKRGNVHIPAIMSVAFPDVVVFDGFILLWSSLFTRKQNAREGKKAHVVISDRTEPVRTGIGAVCFEYGRSKWPMTMLNHTHKRTEPCFVYLLLLIRAKRVSNCYMQEKQN